MQFHPLIPDNPRNRVLNRAIGEFIATWTHVEWAIAFPFSGLARCDLDRSRMILAAMMNFRSRRELLDRLGRAYLPEEHLTEWGKLGSQIKQLSEKRNHLAHRRAYHLEKSTFRFFSDEDECQPNTFGRYSDYQIGNIRNWTKEANELQHLLMIWWDRSLKAKLLEQPRLIPEQSQDQNA